MTERKVPVRDCGESKATERALKANWERYKNENPGMPSPTDKTLKRWSTTGQV